MSKKNELMDVIKLRGSLEYALKDAATGEVVQGGSKNNQVVTVGRAWMLDRLHTNDSQTIDRIYLGTHTTGYDTGDTALGASFSSATFDNVSNASTTANPPYLEFYISWDSDETHANSSAINEFGLFTDEPVMIGRVTTSSTIDFDSTNTLAITYRLSN